MEQTTKPVPRTVSRACCTMHLETCRQRKQNCFFCLQLFRPPRVSVYDRARHQLRAPRTWMGSQRFRGHRILKLRLRFLNDQDVRDERFSLTTSTRRCSCCSSLRSRISCSHQLALLYSLETQEMAVFGGESCWSWSSLLGSRFLH